LVREACQASFEKAGNPLPHNTPPDLKAPGDGGEGLAFSPEQDDLRTFGQTSFDGGGALPAFQLGPFMRCQRDDEG
jgi:hypothetical protein